MQIFKTEERPYKGIKMKELFEIYKENINRQGFFSREHQPESEFFNALRFSMNPRLGQGWAELVQNDNGLCVSLCDYTLTQKLDGESFSEKNFFQSVFRNNQIRDN